MSVSLAVANSNGMNARTATPCSGRGSISIFYSRYAKSDSTENELRAFRFLHPVPGSLHLTWGCGAWNQNISQLRAAGFNVWGDEPSAPASAGHIVKWRGEISARFDDIFRITSSNPFEIRPGCSRISNPCSSPTRPWRTPRPATPTTTRPPASTRSSGSGDRRMSWRNGPDSASKASRRTG